MAAPVLSEPSWAVMVDAPSESGIADCGDLG